MSLAKKIAWGVGILAGGFALLVGGAVAYATATADGRLSFPETPKPNLVASKDPAIIEQGKYLVYGPGHCAQCHSTDERNHPEKVKTEALKGGLEFAMGPIATRYAPNLTPHATGIGKLSDGDLARAIRSGITHTGEWSLFMTIAAAKPSDEDIVAIISYLRSTSPVEHQVKPGEWGPLGQVMAAFALPSLAPEEKPGPKHVPHADEPSALRGKYLAESVALCSGCHTRFDMSTLKSTGPKAGGSDPDPSHGDDSDMEYVAPNLTSHATGFTGKMDEEAFLARLKAGRVYASSIMPWEGFQMMTESDMRSVYRYLKSLPPVDNDPGPSYRKRGWQPGDKE